MERVSPLETLKVYKAIILMFGDRVSLYLTQYVERKHAEDNRNDYPLVVAMVPDPVRG